MLIIEFAPQEDQRLLPGAVINNPTMIWMKGYRWPVTLGEESDILRIEAFGEELNEPILLNVPAGLVMHAEINASPDLPVILRVWYRPQCREVSQKMRAAHP